MGRGTASAGRRVRSVAENAIATGLRNPDPEVRRAVSNALANTFGRQNIPEQLPEDPDTIVRLGQELMTARRALGTDDQKIAMERIVDQTSLYTKRGERGQVTSFNPEIHVGRGVFRGDRIRVTAPGYDYVNRAIGQAATSLDQTLQDLTGQVRVRTLSKAEVEPV